MSTARCSRGTRTGFHETRGFMLPQDFSPGGFTARMLLAGSLMRGWGYLVGVVQGNGGGGRGKMLRYVCECVVRGLAWVCVSVYVSGCVSVCVRVIVCCLWN